MSGLNIVWANRSDGTNRQQEDDYYATEPRAISDLAKFVNIYWVVWENACGNWNLSKELEKLPIITEVISSDLIDRKYWEVLDFFSDEPYTDVDWIITNPPYKYWKDWIEKSLKLAPNVAMLMKLVFLESEGRRK